MLIDGLNHFQLNQLLELPRQRDSLVIYYPARQDHRIWYHRIQNALVEDTAFEHEVQFELATKRSVMYRNPPVFQEVEFDQRGNQQIRYVKYPFLSVEEMHIMEPKPNVITKPAAVAIGPVLLSQPTIVNYRSLTNHVRGLIKRVAHDQNYSKQRIQSFGQFVDKWIQANYTPLPKVDPSHSNLDQYWLSNNKDYTLKQKEHYHDLLQTFLDSNTSIKSFIQDHSAKLYICNSFIKREFYETVKEPRIINGRPDLFKAIVAPYIKLIEHQVIYNEHFIKGKQPDDVANRLRQIHTKFNYVFETDYSSFEGSFSRFIMKRCEWKLFHYMLQNNPEILKLIKPIYFNDSHLHLGTAGRYNATAHFKGSRMSGDMWTSLGNGFTNMMILLYVIKKSVPKRQWSQAQFDFIVEGDDGFFGVNHQINLALVRELGFNLKVKSSTDINETSFCGIHPTDNAFMADFWRLIEKFGWSHDEQIIQNYGSHETPREKQLMRSKALSLLAFAKGNPILQPLAVKILELTDSTTIRWKDFDWWERNTFDLLSDTIKPIDITQSSREYYQHYYGISINDQLDIEDLISRQTNLRFIIPLQRPSVN